MHRRLPQDVLRAYFHAKDENRPHWMPQAFCEDATLETVVRTQAIAFPPVVHGLPAIADVLVRRFAQTYENVYSFYLARPPATIPSHRFSCDWLVAMSEKETGNARVGCGRYDWSFRAVEPILAERLVITIEAMQVLAPDTLPAILGWIGGLGYPWCSAGEALATMPPMPALRPIAECLGRSRG